MRCGQHQVLKLSTYIYFSFYHMFSHVYVIRKHVYCDIHTIKWKVWSASSKCIVIFMHLSISPFNFVHELHRYVIYIYHHGGSIINGGLCQWESSIKTSWSVCWSHKLKFTNVLVTSTESSIPFLCLMKALEKAYKSIGVHEQWRPILCLPKHCINSVIYTIFW